MTKWAALLIVGILLFVGTFNGFVPAAWLTNRVYDLSDLPNPGDPNHPLYKKNRDDRRLAVAAMKDHLNREPPVADPLAPGGTTPQRYYEDRRPAAALARQFEISERKLNATISGTMVPERTSARALGNHSLWQLMRNEDGKPVELFEGDVICSSGTVSNSDYTRHGEIIAVDPDGVWLSKADLPDGFEQKYPKFPMMGFLGRVDGTRIFHIKSGCHPSSVTGKNLEIAVNVPYRNTNGWEASGVATSKGDGAFVVERIEKK